MWVEYVAVEILCAGGMVVRAREWHTKKRNGTWVVLFGAHRRTGCMMSMLCVIALSHSTAWLCALLTLESSPTLTSLAVLGMVLCVAASQLVGAIVSGVLISVTLGAVELIRCADVREHLH